MGLDYRHSRSSSFSIDYLILPDQILLTLLLTLPGDQSNPSRGHKKGPRKKTPVGQSHSQLGSRYLSAFTEDCLSHRVCRRTRTNSSPARPYSPPPGP